MTVEEFAQEIAITEASYRPFLTEPQKTHRRAGIFEQVEGFSVTTFCKARKALGAGGRTYFPTPGEFRQACEEILEQEDQERQYIQPRRPKPPIPHECTPVRIPKGFMEFEI